MKDERMQTMQKISTNSKQVKELVRAHIMEHQESDLELLKANIKALKYNNRSVYQAGVDMVMGGSFLIYHGDVKDFLNGLGINPENKEYTDQKSWDLYVHLVAREIEKLIK